MTFQKKAPNLKLTRQIHTSLSEDTFERWHYLCQRQNKSSHVFLREVVEEYCKKQLAGTTSAYTALDVLKGRA